MVPVVQTDSGPNALFMASHFIRQIQDSHVRLEISLY